MTPALHDQPRAAADPWPARLRGLGLRATQPRLAVLQTLDEQPHLAADQVVALVRRRGAVSVQAVYDTLNTLTEAGVLRRFEPAGSAMRYEVDEGGNHHHLVCRGCGRVEDVPCAVGEVPCAVPPETGGFVVDEAEVTYWGTCAACQAAAHPGPPNHRPDPVPAREPVPSREESP